MVSDGMAQRHGLPSHPSARPEGEGRTAEVVALAFRRHAAELTAQLARMVGLARLDVAEDAVQQALVQAMRTWPFHGIPEDPRAWLAQVARNRLRDGARREAVRRRGAGQQAQVQVPAVEDAPGGEVRFAAELEDDALRLLFACCHPALSEEARLALTLKVACGFSVGEIAAALLAEETAVAQRLVRAKRQLREDGASLEVPGPAELPARLGSVLSVLYLLFNEGYEAAAGDGALKAELCAEALRLVELLAGHPRTGVPEVHALAALLHLLAARLPARVTLAGELVVLAAQDRERWDAEHLGRGFRHLQRSMGERLTRYHLEAGIAAAHASVPSLAGTDWPHVVSLYDSLLVVAPSPVVALNRAIALGEAGGLDEALGALSRLEQEPVLARYPWLPAARAHVLERLGRRREAAVLFKRAALLARTPPQRVLLLQRAEACQ
jgi:RNA polymerase sigma factor (sigma-70 family)